MKRISVPGVWIPALLLLFFSGWPAYGAHNVYLPLLSKDSVLLDPRRIGGEGASILYKGKTYSEPVGVPKSALVGIIKSDQAYLYHPSQGENITLSDTTTKDAFLRFWLGLEEGNQDSAKAIGAEPYSDVVLGDGLGSLPNGGETNLNTYVKIKRSDPKVTITNTIGRWVAVQIYYKESDPKVHYLAPAGRVLDPNVITTLGNLTATSSPLLLFDYSSPCSITLGESTQITKIETFGAVYRGISIYVDRKEWPPGAAESWNGPNHNLVMMVNLIDTMHSFIELVENLAAPLVPACFDLIPGLVINGIEATFLTMGTAEERIKMPYAKAMGRDVFWSAIKCVGWVMSGMSLEAVYTAWDLFVAGGYVVTDLILLPLYVKNASAYSFEELYYPTCETTVKPKIDVYVQAKVRGPAGAGVSYKYIKRYCSGSWGGVIGPYTGTIGSNGTYLAGMLGLFKMENLQDEILVRATVNGTEKQAIVNYGSFGFDGFSLLFPKVVEITFP